jgi:hypothetical protein
MMTSQVHLEQGIVVDSAILKMVRLGVYARDTHILLRAPRFFHAADFEGDSHPLGDFPSQFLSR